MKTFASIAISALLAAPAFAESHATGDAVAGEEAFAKMCVSCHVVVNDEGETLAGKKASIGPNLYGVVGRVAGTLPGYRYGKSMIQVGEAGHVWTEEAFVAYVQDPKGWLRETLDDKRARAKMTFRVRDAADAPNLYAFLASIGPTPEMDAMEETEEMEAAPASN